MMDTRTSTEKSTSITSTTETALERERDTKHKKLTLVKNLYSQLLGVTALMLPLLHHNNNRLVIGLSRAKWLQKMDTAQCR